MGKYQQVSGGHVARAILPVHVFGGGQFFMTKAGDLLVLCVTCEM